ncbi:MAG: hypothetical protein ACRD00_00670, partial [Thermoanaerobaculia bacterium]
REAVASGTVMLRTLDRLWTVSIPPLTGRRPATEDLFGASPADPRVPERNPEIRGPLDVYYYSYLESTGAAAGPGSTPALSKRGNGDVLAYEAFNLVNGRRSVSEIRDILSGLYGPVPLPEVAGYLDLLARAGALRFGH